jgi:WhiB family redox-sensing transcriptional regulator
MQWPETTRAAGGAAAGSREAGDGRQAASWSAATAGTLTVEGLAGPAALAGAAALAGSASVFADLELPCRGDPELFFAELPEDVERAKALCRGCPARLACLAGALERREPCGVWGGELFVHGQVVARKRPRGRPRKTEVAA